MRWWKRKNAKHKRRDHRRVGVVKHDLISQSSEEILYNGNDQSSSTSGEGSGNDNNVSLQNEFWGKQNNANGKCSNGLSSDMYDENISRLYQKHSSDELKSAVQEENNYNLSNRKQNTDKKDSFWSFQVASILTPATILYPSIHLVSIYRYLYY